MLRFAQRARSKPCTAGRAVKLIADSRHSCAEQQLPRAKAEERAWTKVLGRIEIPVQPTNVPRRGRFNDCERHAQRDGAAVSSHTTRVATAE